MVYPTDPITELNRIGTKTQSVLRKLNIETCKDLLYYLPQRYDDLSKTSTIANITPGERVTIKGTIRSLSSARSYRKKLHITKTVIEDETGEIAVTWFGQKFIDKTLSEGDDVYLSGTPKQDLTGLTLTNPVFEKVKAEQLHTGAVVPIYRLTAGISQKQLRFLIKSALDQINEIPNELPKPITASEKLLPLREALQQVHWPESELLLKRAMYRLKFEELYWLQLRAMAASQQYEKKSAPIHELPPGEKKAYIESLPFTLTGDQATVIDEILEDMRHNRPMNRLVEGDVGSGKTVVASVAILNASINGYQSALMAPTELLAQQHFTELNSLLKSHAPKLQGALITGKQAILNDKKIQKKKLLEMIANDEVHFVVGTHSLIQEKITFKKLGVVIIDEQHRFGVQQRKQLTLQDSEENVPHLLSLTATPIPRTLALTLYGELDISIIKEKPRGRKPIITKLVAEHNRSKAYDWIKKLILKDQQVFVLCPLIDESDTSESKSVIAEQKHLNDEIFPEFDVRSVHGKMKSEDKQKLLIDFKNKVFPILVTTSVIEVGIDIPNATVMLIEGAERFGLAQLHQFRGRVGRNDMQSYCLLFSTSHNPSTQERLELLTKHTDGFLLAEKDLQRRGEGDIFGTRQSGLVEFNIATIHDTDIINASKQWVEKTLSDTTGTLKTPAVEQKIQEHLLVHKE